MRTLTLNSAFGALLALALSACPGDSGDDSSTSDPTNTTPPATDPSAGTTADNPTSTTNTPDDTTNTPGDTTNTPDDTTTTPDDTTNPSDDTTGNPDDTTGAPDDTTGDPSGGDVSFAADVYAPIISVKCSCHVNGISGGLAMPDAATAYANLVGVPAGELLTMNRITASDSDNSYLFHKVEGTHLDVGGSGGKMPLGGSLDGGQISTIKNWIDKGALP